MATEKELEYLRGMEPLLTYQHTTVAMNAKQRVVDRRRYYSMSIARKLEIKARAAHDIDAGRFGTIRNIYVVELLQGSILRKAKRKMKVFRDQPTFKPSKEALSPWIVTLPNELSSTPTPITCHHQTNP